MNKPIFVSLLILLAFSLPARAEVILIKSGLETGQGWFFKDGSDCWFVTARHVVSDPNGTLFSGPDGIQGQGTAIVFHPDETVDIAIGKIIGSLEEICPTYGSPLGDRNTAPTLKRLINEGRTISMERRHGFNDQGGGYLFEVLGVQVDAMSESEPLFSLSFSKRGTLTSQSDSGSPVRLRGSGVGEAGLPLGIVSTVETFGDQTFLNAVRMDIIREFYEAQTAAPESLTLTTSKSPTEETRFSISGFTGNTPDTACGPLNLISPETSCGWKVERNSDGARVSLVIEMDALTDFVGQEFEFTRNSNLSGLSVASSVNGQTYSVDRYCRMSNDAINLTCNVAPRKAKFVRVTFEGEGFELVTIRNAINFTY